MALQNLSNLDLVKLVWPQIKLTEKQREILSTLKEDEVVIAASKMLGRNYFYTTFPEHNGSPQPL